MRIALAGLMHETNSFSALPTTATDFRILYGAAIQKEFSGTRTEIGGVFHEARDGHAEVVALAYADAAPGGQVEAEFYASFKERLLCELRSCAADVVILVLHGAMVVANTDDPEGDLLSSAREIAGPNGIIVATLDFHANLSQKMVDNADLLLGYDTNPHVDMFEKGAEAVRLAVMLHQRRSHPSSALVRVPLLTMMLDQSTLQPPMRDIIRLAVEKRQNPAVLSSSVFPGFWPSDAPCTGLTTLVSTDGQPDIAPEIAKELAAASWEKRKALTKTELVQLDEALAMAQTAPSKPLILCDIGDIVGAGAPGDSAVLLSQMLEAGVQDAVFASVADPVAVHEASALEVGQRFSGRIGGTLSNEPASSVFVDGIVRYRGSGVYTRGGPRATGLREDRGQTVVIEAHGITIILTSKRVMADNLEYFTSLGIDPTTRSVLAMKASVHFRAVFEPLASEIVLVDTPGPSNPTAGFNGVTFRNVQRPAYPLDQDVSFSLAGD